MQIILIGFMGVGKTTIGSLLAQKLMTNFVDLDQQFIDEIGLTPGEYMSTYSEAQFREIEQKILVQQLSQIHGVISSGGGILTLPSSRQLLRASKFKVIYLASDFGVNLGRLQGDDNKRPLMTHLSASELHKLWEQRQAHYRSVAHLTIDTNGKTPKMIVEQIIKTMIKGDDKDA